MDSVREETLAVSATEDVLDKKYNRALLLQMRCHRLTEENPRTVLVPEDKVLPEEEAESRAKISSSESVRTRRVIIGTFPYVKNYTSETGCIYGNDCCFRHFEAEEKPSKKSK